MISGIDGIRAAYQDAGVARRYVEERFTTPLGALLHHRQAQVAERVLGPRRTGRTEFRAGARAPDDGVIDVAGQLTLLDASAEMLAEARSRLSSLN